ncbi:hypothetical protein SNE35_03305 [Paucibacter sp. R3-3]|uniref:Lipoprotein n=1 Tax=Roseateles agri TaxID=3098619 RepID=A0ABU5DB69_9BURK|nr:hypothetical protein [Paucibacter sp. R3-3]MDY0743512.1 hypothetical protein [Paucibacter sp. R3-3]
MPSRFLVLSLALPLLIAAGCASNQAVSRPLGLNCSQTKPPQEAGEAAGHGVFLQVFPRSGSIDPEYTGCQAVFLTTKGEPVTLGWLVEVVEGDPVRMWSEDPSLRDLLGCRFRKGKLVAGDVNVCSRRAVILMPSQPAGCVAERTPSESCEDDEPPVSSSLHRPTRASRDGAVG